jgi:hypothetical protein
MLSNLPFKHIFITLLKLLEVAEFDPTRQTRPTRSDPNPTRLDFLGIYRKSNWPDPFRTWPDPTRDQMTFNPIEIYQRSKKIQHVNWPGPTRFLPESQTDPTRLIATSKNYSPLTNFVPFHYLIICFSVRIQKKTIKYWCAGEHSFLF